MRPINLDEPVMEIKHSELKRFGESFYKSECPKCGNGILLMGRDPDTFILQDFDRCITCGQLFRYSDIIELRKKEGFNG